VSTRLERIAKTVHQALPAELSGTPAKFGEREARKHQEKTCIVWNTPGGIVQPAKKTAGQITNEAGKAERINIVGDRFEQVEAHIYAIDAERCERLLDGVIAALREEVGPNAPYPWTYEWFGGSQDTGVANVRPKILLKFSMTLPVADAALGLRTVDAFRHGHATAPDKPHADPH